MNYRFDVKNPLLPGQVVDVITLLLSLSELYLYSLPVGGSLQDALTFGCRVAGWKCGFHGYDSIREKFSS